MLSIVLFDSRGHADAAESVFEEEMPSKLGEVFSTWAGRRVSVNRYHVLAQSLLQTSSEA